jgi:hypothetical protein
MMPDILKSITVILGILLILSTFVSYIYKRITEKIAMWWCLISIIIILSGCVPVLSSWAVAMAEKETYALYIILVVVLLFIFKLSENVSNLKSRNQELAMQVSLLNEENEHILDELKKITSKEKSEIS